MCGRENWQFAVALATLLRDTSVVVPRDVVATNQPKKENATEQKTVERRKNGTGPFVGYRLTFEYH
jgi:hypothetical protein